MGFMKAIEIAYQEACEDINFESEITEHISICLMNTYKQMIEEVGMEEEEAISKAAKHVAKGEKKQQQYN